MEKKTAEDILKQYKPVFYQDSPDTTGSAYDRDDVIDMINARLPTPASPTMEWVKICITEVRTITNLLYSEEISLSKAAELLNQISSGKLSHEGFRNHVVEIMTESSPPATVQEGERERLYFKECAICGTSKEAPDGRCINGNSSFRTPNKTHNNE